MSLNRAIFNEFRPFFRMLEDPFAMDPSFSALSRHRGDPFNWNTSKPALNLTEEKDSYTVEAEIPGVRKENLDLRIGDGGRSLTIEGRIIRGQSSTNHTAPVEATKDAESKDNASTGNPSDAVMRADGQEGQLATSSPWSGVRTFTRTVWLPHRIDSNKVSAKLDDGILTVKATKAKDETVAIAVE